MSYTKIKKIRREYAGVELMGEYYGIGVEWGQAEVTWPDAIS